MHKKNKNQTNITNLSPISIKQILISKKSQILTIIALIFILYGNTLFNEYALDDKAVIIENRFTTKGIKGIKDLITHDHFFGYQNAISGFYRPIPLITHALEYQFFGPNPHISHLVNLSLYILLCIAIYIMLTLWLNKYNQLLPFIITLLYAAHPLHTELVANIKGRDDILNFTFIALSVISSFLYVGNNSLRQLFICWFWFAMALFTKESAITFLLLLPISIYFFTETKWRTIFVVLLGMTIITICYLFIRSQVIDSSNEYRFLDSYYQYAPNRSDRLATGIATLLNYFWLFIFPHPLLYDYSFNQIPLLSWSNLKPIISIMIIVFLILYALITIKNKPIVSFIIIFYYATLSPSSNVITPNPAIFAERFMFIPSLSFVMLLAITLLLVFKIKNIPAVTYSTIPKTNRYALTFFLIAILGGYGIKTITRNTDWKNDTTLFLSDIRYLSNNARANYNASKNYADIFFNTTNASEKQHAYNEAVKYLTRATTIDSLYYDSYFLLGLLHFNNQNYLQATQHFIHCFNIDSNYTNPIYSPENALFYTALAFERINNYTMAIKYYRKLTQYTPKNRPKQTINEASAYNNIGNIYNQTALYDSAMIYLTKAILIDAKLENAYNNLASVYLNLKKYDKALETYLTLQHINPQNKYIYNNIGVCYFNMKQYIEAAAAFTKAIEANPEDANAYHNLGLTYYNQGKKEQATSFFRAALRRNKAYAQAYKQLGIDIN